MYTLFQVKSFVETALQDSISGYGNKTEPGVTRSWEIAQADVSSIIESSCNEFLKSKNTVLTSIGMVILKGVIVLLFGLAVLAILAITFRLISQLLLT